MTWDLLQRYRASATPTGSTDAAVSDDPQADDRPAVSDTDSEHADLDYEVPAAQWQPLSTAPQAGWRADRWEDRPRYFVDGKDVGETVTWLTAPRGYPIAVRLSAIGATVVKVENGVCHREREVVEHVISLVGDVFPWDEVEDLAAAGLRHGFRVLLARPPEDQQDWFEPEKMRKAAQNRTITEMGVLEKALLAQLPGERAVVDGRLEPRAGGLEGPAGQGAPVVGVIKTHSKRYLHDEGMCARLALGQAERTPLFTITGPGVRLPVVSWYLRLSQARGAPPDYGIVRVELPLRWFEQVDWSERQGYVSRLSHLLVEYRCREMSYARAPISLHPIVRAEELLGALFTPWPMLARQFCQAAGL